MSAISMNCHHHLAAYNPALLSSNQGGGCGATKSNGSGAQALDELLIATNKGGALLNPEKKELLEKVATYMDKHPEVFGKPHGKDSWLSELKEDNFLNKAEAKKFGSAIEMIKDAGGAGAQSGVQGQPGTSSSGAVDGGQKNFDNALIPSGNGESYMNPSKQNELESLAKFMDQHPEVFGKPHGADSWLSELKENNHLNKNETDAFNKAIDLLKDAQGALGSNQAGGAGSSHGANSFNPGSFGTQSPANQGGLDLKNALVETGKGDAYLNPSKKEELESVAKYMDQHPEVFGKPHGKDSWLSELKEDNYLSKDETKSFKKGIDMMQDAQGAGGGNNVNNAGTSHATNNFNPGNYGTQPPANQGGLDLKNSLVETGKGDSYLNPSKKGELEAVAKYMDQHPEVFGKPHGKDSWLSELKEDNYLSKDETKSFKKGIDMMQDAQSAGGNGQGNSIPSTNTPPPISKSTDASADKGLDLDNVLVQTGKGDAYFNPSKKAEMESVAKYMDQHPEVFGKPHGKDSWLSELKEDNYLSKNENKAFSAAIDMMKDARAA